MSPDKRMESLETALRHLAGETAGARPAARIETALRAEVRRQRPVRMRWWAMAAAAAMVGVVGFWTLRDREQPMAVETAPVAIAEQVAEIPAVDVAEQVAPAVRRAVLRPQAPVNRGTQQRELSPLTPWYYSDGLPKPARGQIVTIRVSPATAGRFGVVADAPVPAQLLIGDDGLTRAIRFVRE